MVMSGIETDPYGEFIMYPSFSLNTKLFLPNSLSDNPPDDDENRLKSSLAILVLFNDSNATLRNISIFELRALFL